MVWRYKRFCITSKVQSVHNLCVDIQFIRNQLWSTPCVNVPAFYTTIATISIATMHNAAWCCINAMHTATVILIENINPNILNNTGTEMLLFWLTFHHRLHRKLSFWQLSVESMTNIISKWLYIRFSAKRWNSKGLGISFPFYTKNLFSSIVVQICFRKAIHVHLYHS